MMTRKQETVFNTLAPHYSPRAAPPPCGRSRSHCEFSRKTQGLRDVRREVCRRLAASTFRSTVANEACKPLLPVVLDAQELYAHLVPCRLDLACPHGASGCAVRDFLSASTSPFCRPRLSAPPIADIEHGVGCP